MTESLRIELKNRISELERLTQALDQFGRTHRLPEDVLYRIQLALDELVTNVIKYGWEDEEEHSLSVTFLLSPQELAARIEDDGLPFDPLAMPSPDLSAPLESRRIGGLGIHLVRNMVDRTEYQRMGGRNILTVGKRLNYGDH